MMLELIVLLLGALATVGLLWLLVSRATGGGGDHDVKLAGVFLVVVAYAVSELVPSRFVTVTPAVAIASGAVALLCLLVGVGFILGDTVAGRAT